MQEWPRGGLERVVSCPVCGESDSPVLYDRLTDRVFGIAPGVWTLRLCQTCDCAFLDPRPTLDTIGRAYNGDYYTHGAAAGSSERLAPTAPARFRHRVRNSYLNWRFGYRLRPSVPLLGRAVPAVPPLRQAADDQVRHLCWKLGGGSILDVGCGAGQFLWRMSTFGWTVSGLDPDPDATSPYLADIPLLRSQLGPGILPDNSYDAVTMSHVLEHMHQPAVALKCCFDALKPGGVMWLATPNLESPAHRAFGRYWYHLDTPRHVVLFTANALESLLRSTGFVPIQRLSSFWESARHVIEGSRRVMGRDALVPPAVGMPYMPLWRRTTIVLCAMLLGSKEELVYGCVKPLADPAPVTPNEHSVSDQRNSE